MLKHINIQFDTTEEEQVIVCDSRMIERVILNLLLNAIKFSSENTNILGNLSADNDWVKIEAKDEGIGIDKYKKEFIFNRFTQIDKSFTRKK